MKTLLVFADFKNRQLFNNWESLRRAIAELGFPAGMLITPNRRVWTEEEVDDWLATRPVDNPILRGAAKSAKAAKAARTRRDTSEPEAA
jgi:hypothetical protein